MVIGQWIIINNTVQGSSNAGFPASLQSGDLSPEMLYENLQHNYPKFFKMDKLCKWAWIATEYLFAGDTLPYAGFDKNRVAVCLTTSHGCLDVDKRYLDNIAIPSPALFVYTLPNIMLGEVCIRHGFKGEQLCMINEKFDAEELCFTITGLLNRGMDACLCGWVDVFDDQYDVCLFWVTKKGMGLDFTPTQMQEIYKGHWK